MQILIISKICQIIPSSAHTSADVSPQYNEIKLKNRSRIDMWKCAKTCTRDGSGVQKLDLNLPPVTGNESPQAEAHFIN